MVSFCIGQLYFQYKHDPDKLIEAAKNLAVQSYFAGCESGLATKGIKSPELRDVCTSLTTIHLKDMRDILDFELRK